MSTMYAAGILKKVSRKFKYCKQEVRIGMRLEMSGYEEGKGGGRFHEVIHGWNTFCECSGYANVKEMPCERAKQSIFEAIERLVLFVSRA